MRLADIYYIKYFLIIDTYSLVFTPVLESGILVHTFLLKTLIFKVNFASVTMKTMSPLIVPLV